MGAEFDNLHQVLRSLYTEMMPMCGDMIGVAKGIAGLGALFYVALRVWQTLAIYGEMCYICSGKNKQTKTVCTA